MDIPKMRAALISVYPNSIRWKNRVNGMPTNQVVAVYRSFQKYDRFNKAKKRKQIPEQYHQMDLWELGLTNH